MNQLFKRLPLILAVCCCTAFVSVAQKKRTRRAPVAKADLIEEVTLLEKFSPPGGGFSILMPRKPIAGEQEVETQLGKLKNHWYTADGAGISYGVVYADFPSEVTDPEVVRGMFDNARIDGLAAVHGRLISEQDIVLDGNPGREMLVSLPGGALLRARMYQVRARFYQVIVRLPSQDPVLLKALEFEVMKFFDSFTLLGQNAQVKPDVEGEAKSVVVKPFE